MMVDMGMQVIIAFIMPMNGYDVDTDDHLWRMLLMMTVLWRDV